MTRVRSWAKWVAQSPLHPQWLLGPKLPPPGIQHAQGKVLDIGSADRWIAGELPAHVEYIALDYPSTGQALYHSRPDIFADAARLPFPSDCFDGVVCLEVLEHVRDPAMVVLEIARVLQSGGRAWISMPFLYPLHDPPFDFQRYTEFGLRRDIGRAGLEIVSLQKSGHAVRTAGLLATLAIAGGLHARGGLLTILLLPLALPMIFAINLLAWSFSRLWPDWTHLGLGHDVEVRKP